MSVNGITVADIDEETLSSLRKGEPKYLIIRNYAECEDSIQRDNP